MSILSQHLRQLDIEDFAKAEALAPMLFGPAMELQELLLNTVATRDWWAVQRSKKDSLVSAANEALQATLEAEVQAEMGGKRKSNNSESTAWGSDVIPRKKKKQKKKRLEQIATVFDMVSLIENLLENDSIN